MRFRFALLCVLIPAFAVAQGPLLDGGEGNRAGALLFVVGLRDADTGAFRPAPKAPVSLRATSAAIRAIKYLNGLVPQKEKTAEFVLKCYDPKTGAFAEPGGKPDVATTAIGVFAATELDIPKDKYPKALDYLKENAKAFEDVRLAAAAVEAWGVKDCPFDLKPWVEMAKKHAEEIVHDKPADGGGPREIGSAVALILRLGFPVEKAEAAAAFLSAGQRTDGGWGKAGEKASDGETTYRVMRALMLLKQKPNDPDDLRSFLRGCRNPDGGYGTKPGEASSVSGTYYYAIITKWLNDMSK